MRINTTLPLSNSNIPHNTACRFVLRAVVAGVKAVLPTSDAQPNCRTRDCQRDNDKFADWAALNRVVINRVCNRRLRIL